MSWLEAFGISLMVIGIGGCFLGAIINVFVSRVSHNNQKALAIVNLTMIVLIIAGIFLFIPVVRHSGRNLNKKDTYSYTPKKEYSSNSDWGNYDYDNDGQINQNEWENALGDYMDNIMP